MSNPAFKLACLTGRSSNAYKSTCSILSEFSSLSRVVILYANCTSTLLLVKFRLAFLQLKLALEIDNWNTG